ncbi:MAG: preprotein translocase subunit SecE [Oscillospiraceae bacterium]|nr:preprotein translocase subunit SecE [Oscillospiraceae bacterium]
MANNKKARKNTSSALAKAEAKAEQIVNSKSKDKNKSKDKQNGIVKYFKELRSEFKKVVWPSRKTVFNNTGVVLVVMVVCSLVIWGLDTGFSALLKLLVG